MTNCTKDFLFGNIDGIKLSDLKLFAECMGDGFMQHINRLLLEKSNHTLDITDETSEPIDFHFIMLQLDGHIDLVKLSATSEVNYALKESGFKTLVINVYLKNGCLSFKAHWNAYKKTRAYELIRALNIIYLLGLLPKTILDGENGLSHPDEKDSINFVKEIFKLINSEMHYPESLDTNEKKNYCEKEYEKFAEKLVEPNP